MRIGWKFRKTLWTSPCRINDWTNYPLSLFSSHRKNWFAARCEYLQLIKKNLERANRHCEFFLIRCKHSQRAANQFLWWLEKKLYTMQIFDFHKQTAEFTKNNGLASSIVYRIERSGTYNICRPEAISLTELARNTFMDMKLL